MEADRKRGYAPCTECRHILFSLSAIAADETASPVSLTCESHR
ncbi:hypothetical protein HMPREF1554_01049 [Porphyromonas gingivalis F0569]|nr:hypothetical protein HMPREF1554_01049 [Porphyromonas gingivalis F0569]